MKKFSFFFCILSTCIMNLWADKMNLGNFATGYWADPRYKVVWEFKSDGIRIIDEASKKVLYDFRTREIENIKVEVGATGVVLKYDNITNGWKYEITKGLSLNADLEAKITLDSGRVAVFPLTYTDFKIEPVE